jgi:peroxiredoxin (alkyl hydroperoxide reductase subunit C)
MFISKPAPDFRADALMPDGTFSTISISQFKQQKYVLLFFYPLDFTFVCPSEIIAFSKRMDDFKARNTEIIGVSIDSKFTHNAWTNTSVDNGGVGKISFPLASDLSKMISKDYDVLLNNSISVRATIIIDKEGIIRHYSLNDLSLGRNVEEFLRLIDALQHTEKYGEVCPAGWRKGNDAIKPTTTGIKKFLKENASNL